MTDEPILWAHLMAQGGPDDGRGARRALVHRARSTSRTSDAPRSSKASRSWPRKPIAQTGQDISAAVAALHEAGAERDRALRLRPRRRGDQRRARSARLGSAALHGHRVRDRLQRAPVGRVPRLDRARAVRRGQPGRSAVPRPSTKPRTVTDPSTTARCSGATARWRSCTRSPTPRRSRPWASRTRSSGSRCCRPRAARRARASRSARGSTAAGWARLPRRPVARRRRQGTRRVLEVVARRSLRPGLNRLGGQMLR